jgi:hypothetical protein
MRPVVIVVVLPLPQLLVEQVNVIGHAVLVEELIELLVVDPMGPFNFAVKMRRARPDVHVADVQGFDVRVEQGLEFAAVVDDACTQRAAIQFVNEVRRRLPVRIRVIQTETLRTRIRVQSSMAVKSGCRDDQAGLHLLAIILNVHQALRSRPACCFDTTS